MDRETSDFNGRNILASVPGERPVIGIFGKRNAGKSTLFNLLLGQDLAVVSEHKGTTTDPVRKAMELQGIGAVTLVDTPGYDDEGGIGSLRVERAIKSASACDVALLVTDGLPDAMDRRWAEYLEGRGAAVVIVSRQDACGREGVFSKIQEALSSRAGQDAQETILGGLVSPADTVVLVMPQDKAAPKGRLIMPQMQTIRELLDRGCIPVCVSPDNLPGALSALSVRPRLVITDSQAFVSVRRAMRDFFGTDGEDIPRGLSGTDAEVISDIIAGVPLTSFSILFSRYKGDIAVFRKGAWKIGDLDGGSHVLIAEACAHRPLSEDIGRVKLPALLRKKAGEDLKVDIVSGSDWPSDLAGYDLIIHCGACMFNRRLVLSRIADAQDAGVPITNYGLAISALTRPGGKDAKMP